MYTRKAPRPMRRPELGKALAQAHWQTYVALAVVVVVVVGICRLVSARSRAQKATAAEKRED